MNTVEVTVYAHQGRWNENNLWFYDDEPGILEEIRLGKAAGMNVVLILRLQLDHAFEANRFKWHGMVFPETEYLLHRWFEEYGRFVKKWSLIAEEEGVEEHKSSGSGAAKPGRPRNSMASSNVHLQLCMAEFEQ